MNTVDQNDYTRKSNRFAFALIALILLSGGLIYAVSYSDYRIDFDKGIIIENRNDPKIDFNDANVLKIDKEAERILKSMSNFLENAQQFTFHSSGYFEYVIDSTKQKIQVSNESNTAVKRPNKLLIERKGDIANVNLYYDGKQVTLFGKKLNYYAQTSAPSTLDKTIDFVRDELDVDAPAGDLLYSNVYQGLMEDVISGSYIGKSTIEGVDCHHLAFRGNEVDWEIWIEDGARPFPVKYVITSKKVEGDPEFSITMTEWNTKPKFGENYFTFSPPKGANKIEFMKGTISEEAKKTEKK